MRLRLRIRVSWWMVYRVCNVLRSTRDIFSTNSLHKLSDSTQMERVRRIKISLKEIIKISGIDLLGWNR